MSSTKLSISLLGNLSLSLSLFVEARFLSCFGDNRSQELSNGIDRARGMIQSVLDDRLEMWEGYCVRYTFAVPEDLVLPESDNSSVHNDRNIRDGSDELGLDAELDSLRHKLHLERGILSLTRNSSL